MTAEAFLAVLEKSGLLKSEQFAEAQDATLLTNDAVELADILVKQGLLTSWQAGQLLAGRTALLLGNYALMDVLGRGGMGKVFLARHVTMNRRVAIKVIYKGAGKDPASKERFLAEARSIAALDHPNIMRAYDVNNENDRFYIVMEYVEGRDLETIVRENGLLGYEEIAECIRQTANGLAHAHGRNIIHCDIKPSNLLLSEQGVIKILDMGMARLAGGEEDSSEQRENKVLGTIDYMSPEQAMDGPNFDHRADIYSLGCTLYFLLTGRPPFDSGTLAQRIIKHQTQDPPDIYEVRPDAPRDLVDICLKMMAKDPADRYQTAEEVSRLLSGWQMPRQTVDTAERSADARAGAPPVARPTILAMEELSRQNKTAGDAKRVDKKPRMWSEEQHTVILVAVFILVAIVVLVGTLIAMFFRSESTTVAQQTVTAKSSDQTKGQPDATIPATTKDKEEDAKKGSEPKQPDRVVTDQAKDGVPAQPPQLQVPPKEQQPGTTQVPKQPTDAGKTPEPTKVAPPDTKKANDKKEKKKKQPVVKPEVTPEVKPPVLEPFHEFPRAVDLRLLPTGVRQSKTDSSEPFTLAPIYPTEKSTMTISLLGGMSALSMGDRFAIVPEPVEGAAGGAAAGGKRAWLVKIERGKAGNPPGDIARIWCEKNALMFKWLPDAAPNTADNLRYCELDITIDGQTRSLALLKPQSVEPLVVDLYKGPAERTLSAQHLPNVNDMRLEITSLGGRALRRQLKQTHVLKIREKVDIEISIGTANPVVFRVSYVFKGGKTSLDISYLFQPSGWPKQALLKEAEWKKIEAPLNNLLANRKKLAADIKKQKGKPPTPALEYKQKQLNEINKKVAEIGAILKFRNAVNGKGQIHFREFIDTPGRQIELIKSDAQIAPVATPAPAAPADGGF